MLTQGYVYEIDHCIAFGLCSARGITPSSLLVCKGQRWYIPDRSKVQQGSRSWQ